MNTTARSPEGGSVPTVSRDPWRPQDVPDAILGRSSRKTPEQTAFGDDFEVSMPDEVDSVYVVMQGDLPVMWPMALHRHGQDCRRA